ncbi:MAG: radical SAM family heme chaperone HemW [Erysipelotrichaceae bacterium]
MSNKGLYIHIPFCRVYCNYCDFCRYTNYQKVGKQYLKTLNTELNSIKDKHFSTIYIGGGTPSMLNNNDLADLLSYLKGRCLGEYTIECNVEDISEDFLKLLVKYGVNRLSIGIQSFHDHLLKQMNRNYTSAFAFTVLALVKKYFTNYSIDLIYGLPNQSLADFKKDLLIVRNLGVPHISLYGLTIEENSIWGKLNFPDCDEGMMNDFYHLAQEILSNYHHYEISNFALDNHRAQHNLLYWHYQDYYAVGISASGKNGNIRYTNVDNFEEYFKDFKAKKEYLTLAKKDQMFEYLMMNFRLESGINLQAFNNLFQVDFLVEYECAIKKNSACLVINSTQIAIKKDYWYISNEILIDFL